MSPLEHLSEHPQAGPMLFIAAIVLHTIAKMQEVLFVSVSPDVLAFTEWISFILAILASICTLVVYGYKFYKWLKK